MFNVENSLLNQVLSQGTAPNYSEDDVCSNCVSPCVSSALGYLLIRRSLRMERRPRLYMRPNPPRPSAPSPFTRHGQKFSSPRLHGPEEFDSPITLVRSSARCDGRVVAYNHGLYLPAGGRPAVASRDHLLEYLDRFLVPVRR